MIAKFFYFDLQIFYEWIGYDTYGLGICQSLGCFIQDLDKYGGKKQDAKPIWSQEIRVPYPSSLGIDRQKMNAICLRRAVALIKKAREHCPTNSKTLEKLDDKNWKSDDGRDKQWWENHIDFPNLET